MDFVRPIEAIIPGAQGRILAALVETSAELNLREVAQLAAVSPAQASRVLPGLVELGVVERREVPPSSLFRLVPTNIAASALVTLARSTDAVLDEMSRLASTLPQPPQSVIVFGSFARREAVAPSDIDVLVVRPGEVDEDDEDDEAWAVQLQDWSDAIRRLTGNPVEILEFSPAEASARIGEGSELFRQVCTDGQLIFGSDLDCYVMARGA